MRWLGLFTNETFRKHRKLIFPHRDFIIWLHLHSVFGNFASTFFHSHFIIRIFPSAFYHPPSSAPHFIETRRTKDFSHLHSIRLIWGTASELGLSVKIEKKTSIKAQSEVHALIDKTSESHLAEWWKRIQKRCSIGSERFRRLQSSCTWKKCMVSVIPSIDYFTVVGEVTWPLNDSEAGVDLVVIKTSLLLLCKSSCSYAN